VNRGLANAFATGIEACLAHGADIIVNTDADNQYCAQDMGKLLAPIMTGEADLVVGARPIAEIASFSLAKKILQGIGSCVVRLMSGTRVSDATSGFRAMNQAALRVNVFSRYTYTLETIIQAAHRYAHYLKFRARARRRRIRLARNSWLFLRSGGDLLRVFLRLSTAPVFMTPALASFAIATVIALIPVLFIASDEATGHIKPDSRCNPLWRWGCGSSFSGRLARDQQTAAR
jgi:glycosyltransferase involved in cell wall biosynthesis